MWPCTSCLQSTCMPSPVHRKAQLADSSAHPSAEALSTSGMETTSYIWSVGQGARQAGCGSVEYAASPTPPGAGRPAPGSGPGAPSGCAAPSAARHLQLRPLRGPGCL